MNLTPARRAVLERAAPGKLIISHPRGFHEPYSPAHWEGGDRAVVNAQVLNALVDAGFLNCERDGLSSYIHEIRPEYHRRGRAIEAASKALTVR